MVMRRAVWLSMLVIALGASGSAGRGASGLTVADAQAASCPWMNASLSPNTRAQMLLSAMTLADKIAMVHQPENDGYHHGAAGWIPAIPSLCVPDLVLNDAGEGVGVQQVMRTYRACAKKPSRARPKRRQRSP
jgi:hypothetical protein